MVIKTQVLITWLVYFPCISLSRPVYIVLPRGDNYDIFFIYNRANVDAVVNFLI